MSAQHQRIEDLVKNSEYVGRTRTTHIRLQDKIFDPQDSQIKQDLNRMILQYLNDVGCERTVLAIQDEINEKKLSQQRKYNHIKKMKKAILEGDWTEVEQLCSKDTFKNEKEFLYDIYKQIYLECIEKGEYQKAFTYLAKRLKPLESKKNSPEEFRDLCYALTCKSVQDAYSFKNWDGTKGSSREQLIEKFSNIFEMETSEQVAPSPLPPHRLLDLLHQAVAYQIDCSRYQPKDPVHITTIMEDFRCFVVPNAEMLTLTGHSANVKCVEFVGEEGYSIISGSSDNTLKIWNPETGKCTFTVQGHTNRVWDVAANKTGTILATVGGNDVKLWKWCNDSDCTLKCLHTITGVHDGDIYSVFFHPDQGSIWFNNLIVEQNHIVTAGYDKTVRIFDVRTGGLKKTFAGHNSSVAKAVTNPHGNMIVTGSKDGTIKFWDIVSGLCIKTVSSHLGEVTSVQINSSGTQLLSASKDNSNKLWDLRTGRSLKRFKGHQNTSKNYIRACFGPNESLIISGSEDGHLYIWDIHTAELLQKLKGHKSIAYSAAWSQQQSLLASCSDDCTVKTWWYDSSKGFDTANSKVT